MYGRLNAGNKIVDTALIENVRMLIFSGNGKFNSDMYGQRL